MTEFNGLPLPPYLDVCCGGEMFYIEKADVRVLKMDIREVDTNLCSDGRRFTVKPDVIGDFRNMPFEDESFYGVFFDPPHLLGAGKTGFQAIKYGTLDRQSWKEDLRKGFAECFRVLKPHGFLAFKWNETKIPLKKILSLTTEKALIGNMRPNLTKTHWLLFTKQPGEF